MNFDLCRHMLLSYDNAENEPQAGSDAPAPLRREFQQAMRHTLLSPMAGCSSKNEKGGAGRGAGGVAPRVLSFTERPPPPQDRYTNVLKVRAGLGPCLLLDLNRGYWFWFCYVIFVAFFVFCGCGDLRGGFGKRT